ncbi:MAG TPA: hypothetical protein DDY13_16150 [Cytophagales bacterium]|nr:hypothetical protein [Cytophagales bacterium]
MLFRPPFLFSSLFEIYEWNIFTLISRCFSTTSSAHDAYDQSLAQSVRPFGLKDPKQDFGLICSGQNNFVGKHNHFMLFCVFRIENGKETL